MSALASCILTITAAAILGSVIRELAGSGVMGSIVRFLVGLFVALTVLSPLIRLELPDVRQWLSDYRYEGQAAAASGENMAQEARQAFIKNHLESYIEDKAASYGAVLEAEVVLSGDAMPVSVTLHGSVTTEAQAALEKIMATDLDLRKEAQHWIE